MGTYVQIRLRTAYLRGETDYSTSSNNTIINSDVNASVTEACNAFNYTWTQSLVPLSFDATGTLTLPSDYNPRWHIPDMRLADGSGQTFQEIPLADRDLWSSNQYKYWILYDNVAKVYKAFSKTVSAAVSVVYHFYPTDMTTDSDVCVIPDTEAVAYLAASKNWLSDERNQALKADFEGEAQTRLKALYATDLAFGAADAVGNPVDSNFQLQYKY